jgi:hypothetical protein
MTWKIRDPFEDSKYYWSFVGMDGQEVSHAAEWYRLKWWALNYAMKLRLNSIRLF